MDKVCPIDNKSECHLERYFNIETNECKKCEYYWMNKVRIGEAKIINLKRLDQFTPRFVNEVIGE
ncbi:MAG: hypothetical protein WDA59_00130 [Methanofastidiosum sp.]|jgi:Zn-finger nucleic acid-binding protein